MIWFDTYEFVFSEMKNIYGMTMKINWRQSNIPLSTTMESLHEQRFVKNFFFFSKIFISIMNKFNIISERNFVILYTSLYTKCTEKIFKARTVYSTMLWNHLIFKLFIDKIKFNKQDRFFVKKKKVTCT